MKHYIFTALLLLTVFNADAGPTKQNPEVPPLKTKASPPPKIIQYDCVKFVSSQIKITNWFFGIRTQDKNRKFTYTPAKKIPFKPGRDVGFKVWIESKKPNIHWSYEYELSQPLPSWPKVVNDSRAKFSDDFKMVTLTDVIRSKKGVLEEFWYFIKGDPAGFYRMTVYLDGFKACEFIFDVQK